MILGNHQARSECTPLAQNICCYEKLSSDCSLWLWLFTCELEELWRRVQRARREQRSQPRWEWWWWSRRSYLSWVPGVWGEDINTEMKRVKSTFILTEFIYARSQQFLLKFSIFFFTDLCFEGRCINLFISYIWYILPDNCLPPVNADCQQCEDWTRDTEIRYEVVEGAVHGAKYPVPGL